MSNNFIFQSNWFPEEQATRWEKYLAHLKGKPNLLFLEIGSFEGRSTVWLLQNVLTHPTSQIVCVDTFDGSSEHQNTELQLNSLEDHFMHNINQIGAANKVIKMKGTSKQMLKRLPSDIFDFIYVDGSHKAADVLEDAVLSFPLLKKNGIISFDDYDNNAEPDNVNEAELGINAFLQVYKDQYELLYKGLELIIRKI